MSRRTDRRTEPPGTAVTGDVSVRLPRFSTAPGACRRPGREVRGSGVRHRRCGEAPARPRRSHRPGWRSAIPLNRHRSPSSHLRWRGREPHDVRTRRPPCYRRVQPLRYPAPDDGTRGNRDPRAACRAADGSSVDITHSRGIAGFVSAVTGNVAVSNERCEVNRRGCDYRSRGCCGIG